MLYVTCGHRKYINTDIWTGETKRGHHGHEQESPGMSIFPMVLDFAKKYIIGGQYSEYECGAGGANVQELPV